MKRKDFLRNITLAFAAAILPKILQPSSFDIEEEIINIPVQINWVVYNQVGDTYVSKSPQPTNFVFRLTKTQAKVFNDNLNK